MLHFRAIKCDSSPLRKGSCVNFSSIHNTAGDGEGEINIGQIEKDTIIGVGEKEAWGGGQHY